MFFFVCPVVQQIILGLLYCQNSKLLSQVFRIISTEENQQALHSSCFFFFMDLIFNCLTNFYPRPHPFFLLIAFSSWAVWSATARRRLGSRRWGRPVQHSTCTPITCSSAMPADTSSRSPPVSWLLWGSARPGCCSMLWPYIGSSVARRRWWSCRGQGTIVVPGIVSRKRWDGAASASVFQI